MLSPEYLGDLLSSPVCNCGSDCSCFWNMSGTEVPALSFSLIQNSKTKYKTNKHVIQLKLQLLSLLSFSVHPISLSPKARPGSGSSVPMLPSTHLQCLTWDSLDKTRENTTRPFPRALIQNYAFWPYVFLDVHEFSLPYIASPHYSHTFDLDYFVKQFPFRNFAPEDNLSP
jgi:hypothetical protein